MKNLSSEFKQALAENKRNYLAFADITLADSTSLSLTNSEIWNGGFSYEEAVSNDDEFTAIGSVIIGSATLIINNIHNTYSSYDFTNAEVVMYLGMQFTNRLEKFKIGTYTVDETNYNGATIRLSLLDNMEQFDRPYSSSTLAYPATLDQIVREACLKCGIQLHTTDFPQKTFVINTKPDDESITFREVLSWCAAIAGCFAKCNTDGKLELKWFDQETLESFTTDSDIDTFFNEHEIHRISSLNKQDISIDDVVITGIAINVKDESEDAQSSIIKYFTGTSDYIIEVQENPFITKLNVQTIMDWLSDELIGLRFRKLNVSQLDDPSIESGDIGIVIDRKQNIYKILITRVGFSVGTFQTIVCGASTPSRNSSTRFSSQTKSYVESRRLWKKEASIRQQLIEELTERISEQSGLYYTIQETASGNIYYLHDMPDLADSSIVWKMTRDAFGVSTNGGQTWNAGLTVDGNLIANILTAIGIDAGWINAGELVIRDTHGNITFSADTATGQVVIRASDFSLTDGSTIQSISQAAANTAVKNINAGTANILRGTNTVTKLGSTTGTWGTSTWKRNSYTGKTRTSINVTNCPNANVKKGWNLPGSTSDKVSIIQDNVPVVAGQTYTFSCYVKGSGKFEFQYGVNKYVYKRFTLNNVTSWKRVFWTEKLSTKTGYVVNGKTNVWFGNAMSSGTIQICGMKLETGNMATDWSESPEEAKLYTDKAKASFTQTEIFNRLTDNGKTQGIYLSNKKIYINASYIKTGSISANYMTTGVLKDKKGKFYLNLDTGKADLVLNSLKLVVSSGASKTEINVSPKDFRLQATQLQWKSSYSSLSADGKLDVKEAKIRGVMESVPATDSYNGTTKTVLSNGEMTFRYKPYNGNSYSDVFAMYSGYYGRIYAPSYTPAPNSHQYAPALDNVGTCFMLRKQNSFLAIVTRDPTSNKMRQAVLYENRFHQSTGNDAYGNLYPKSGLGTVHFNCDINMHGHEITGYFGCTKTFTFKAPTAFNTDGTVRSWINAKLVFRNGVLKGFSWVGAT